MPNRENEVIELRRWHGWLLAVIALGFALRLYHLGLASLWYDEQFTRMYPDFGLRYMWTEGMRNETNPPLYFSIMLAWMHLFGSSEFALRLPSVLISTLTIPVVYLLGHKLAGRSVGLIAALIFAIAPMELYYAQEARTYAFMPLPATLMLLGLASFGRWPAWICYTVGAVLLLYLHATAVFIVTAGGLVGLALIWRMHDRGAMLLRWVAVNVVVAAFWIPQLLGVTSQLHTNTFAWMQPTTFWDVRESIATLIVGPATYPDARLQALAIVFGLALLIALIDFRKSYQVVMVLIGMPSVYVILMLGFTLYHPILLPRLLCWLWSPLSVLVACCMVQRRRFLLIGATSLVLTIGLGFQLAQDATAKEPWRLFLSRLDPVLRTALIVTGPSTIPTPLAYYSTLEASYWANDAVASNVVTVRMLQRLRFANLKRADLVAAIRTGGTVVLIQRDIDRRYPPLLDAPPPTRIVTQPCWGGHDCLSALIWGPSQL
jgi:4-amino-4-deoxy-L-arabinose transferase-like glycosyltransferase